MRSLRVLALIPARGGSKRLPGKNIRILGEKPLIAWSIDVAKDVPEICDILVSTDDQQIFQVAKDAGALTPWLRPHALATDTSRSMDVVLHAINWYESQYRPIDGVLLLQPTSPFRTRKTIQAGITLFRDNGFRPVLSVSPTHAHPFWTFRIESGLLTPFIKHSNLQVRSQDLPPAYVINGAFYLATPAQLRSCESFFTEDALPLLAENPAESLDIDSPFDFFVAECIAGRKKVDDDMHFSIGQS